MKKVINSRTRKLAMLLLTIGLLVSIVTFSQIIIEKQELENANQQLQEENKLLEAKNNYMEIDAKRDNQNSYTNWLELEEVANKLVDLSEGEFKKTWALYLAKQTQQMDMDPYIVYELLSVESGGTFDPELVGPETKYGRAHGLAQFMKNTAPWIADMAELPYKADLLYDPYYSIQLSVVYLDFLHNQYGNWDEALTAYNRGMAGLEEYVEKNGHAESSYAKRIQANAESYEEIALR